MKGRSCVLMTAWLALLPPAFPMDSPAPAAGSPARIGMPRPKVEIAGADPAQVAEAIRAGLADYLDGPDLAMVPLQARLASQISAEASAAECDVLLTVTLSHKRSSDGVSLGKALGNFSTLGGYLPGNAGVQSAIVTGAMQTASDLATSVKAKDELTLTFQLTVPGQAGTLLQDKLRRRASADGEDLLTPLIEGAAEAVGNYVLTHPRR